MSTSRVEEIRANLDDVERRIAASCERSGRRREDVTLVAVSKTFGADSVEAAIAAGVTHVGENRVQEAREKKPSVTRSARWHLIGHLQSNKAKDAVRLFDVIETIDSMELAERVAKAAAAAGKRQEVLIQVNIGNEEQKSGVTPAETAALARGVRAIEGLSLLGIMAIPPFDADPRPFFRQLRGIAADVGAGEISMGMSDDFEIAIEEGSTIVRVGRAIFGSRG